MVMSVCPVKVLRTAWNAAVTTMNRLDRARHARAFIAAVVPAAKALATLAPKAPPAARSSSSYAYNHGRAASVMPDGEYRMARTGNRCSILSYCQFGLFWRDSAARRAAPEFYFAARRA